MLVDKLKLNRYVGESNCYNENETCTSFRKVSSSSRNSSNQVWDGEEEEEEKEDGYICETLN